MGNNPAAILVAIGIVVETGSGPLTWSSLQQAAEREGLLAPVATPNPGRHAPRGAAAVMTLVSLRTERIVDPLLSSKCP
jgi:hypothetical protein